MTQNDLPERSIDGLGELVSAFIEERVDGPTRGEGAPWFEAVCAGLFSAGFEATMRLREAREGPAALENLVRSMVEDITASASVWVNRRLSEKPRCWRQQPLIRFDMTDAMRQRLIAYFNEAIGVMADRGYTLGVARSHACFALISQAVEALIVKGELPTAEAAQNFLRSAFDGCEAMGAEIAEALEKRQTQVI